MKQARARPPRRIKSQGVAVADRRIDVGGIILRYLEAGDEQSEMPLLMLHGFQAGADLWLPSTLPALASEHHVIAPDTPGFGYSGRLRTHNLESYSHFFELAIQALGYSQVNVLGHSLGGQIAIALAARAPQRINRLVLVDSAGLPQAGPQWQAPVRMLTDASARHLRLYPLMMRLAMRASAMREGLLMLQEQHVESQLKHISAPTLIIWGSRDRVAPLEHGAFMAKHIPNARLAIIRGAGHMPFYQKPEQFNSLALKFLSAPAVTPDTGTDAKKNGIVSLAGGH